MEGSNDAEQLWGQWCGSSTAVGKAVFCSHSAKVECFGKIDEGGI